MRNKVINLLSVMAVVLAMTTLSACGPNETEKALDGKWESTTFIDLEDGTFADMVLEFDTEDMTGLHTERLYTDIENDAFMEVSVKFHWVADKEKISYDYYGDPEVKVKSGINKAAAALETTPKELEKNVKEVFLSRKVKEALAEGEEDEIIYLTNNSLTILDDELEKTTFERVGVADHTRK